MPEEIGRYEVRREIGRGGMATVYLAVDPRIGRQVAIKVLPRYFMHDPRYLKRFDQEARVIAALEHPSIVTIHDYGEHDDAPYIVMRYMPGGSLRTRIERGPLSLDEIASVFKQLAPALDYAHRRGVIHRDLKPSNILFDEEERPYLADFGIARMIEASRTTNDIAGTPAYMSPEQVEGGKELDGRSDVYALGVILYELLTGEQPYKEQTPTQTMMAHVLKPVPNVLEVNPDLSPEVRSVVEKAMAKDREDRYGSTSEFATAVKNLATTPSREADALVMPPPQPEVPRPEEAIVDEPQAPAEPAKRPADPRLKEAIVKSLSEPAPSDENGGFPRWLWWVGALVLLAAVIFGISTVLESNFGEPDSSTLSGETTEEGAPSYEVEKTPVEAAEPVEIDIPAPPADVDEAPEVAPPGSQERPFKILFVPVAEPEVLLSGGAVLADALTELTGYSFEVSVPESYRATIEEMCTSPDDTIGFVPTQGYVLAKEMCGIYVGGSGVRFGNPWYSGQFVVRNDSGIESLKDLDGLTWAFPSYQSVTGFSYPQSTLLEAGVEWGEEMQTNSHGGAMQAVYDGEVDFGTAYFNPPRLPYDEREWIYGEDDPEIWRAAGESPVRSESGEVYVAGMTDEGGYQILDARTAAMETIPDIFNETRILALTPPIPEDTISFGPEFPLAPAEEIMKALSLFIDSESCQESLCSEELYAWTGIAELTDSAFDPVRTHMNTLGITAEEVFGE